jgi:hypothetical protein
MAVLSLTDIVFNSDIESATVNSIFAEIENFLGGTTASADITITGTMTADQFQTAADGSSIGSGAYIMGASDDSGIYWDGSDIVAEAATALTNSVQYLSIKHNTSGTPAAGIGSGLKALVETASGNFEIGGLLSIEATDVTSTSEDFDFVIKLMAGGAAPTEIARFQSDGKLDLISGAEYQINGTDVLSSTTLGAGVVTSSLTTVGALDSGSITSGFGSIDVGSSAITTTGAITGNTLTGTLQTAAQTNVTSLGTLTSLTVDDITINGNTISSAGASALTITATAGQAVSIESVTLDGGVVSGVTDLTITGDLTVDTSTLYVDSSNDAVGIGTTSITSGFELEVIGDARFGDVAGDDAVELGWSSGGGQGFIQVYDRGASAFRDLVINNAVTIDSSGNMGVGYSTINSQLQVNGDIGLIDGMSAPSATAGVAKLFVDTSDGDLKVIFGDGTTKTIATDT